MNSKYKTPILLIEDHAGEAEVIIGLLEEAGYKCEPHRTETLFEGLAFLQKTQIDLVLLDLNLPDSTGFKTITSFVERAPNVPFIVITNTNNEIIGHQAVKAGAQDFLIKGQFDSKVLGRVMRFSVQRSKTQQKLEETAKELEITKKRFVEAQEMAHFGAWEMDLVSNEMKWTDEVFRIFGFQPGIFSPTLSEYMNYVQLEDRIAVETFFESISKSGKLQRLEHRILIDGKSVRHLTIYGKLQFDEGNNKIFLVGGIQDITERKLSERLMLEKNITSKAAQIQEEALSELSFQIRTPLSSIVNLLFLMEQTAVSTLQSTYLKDLKTSTDDLSIAVNNLLNFSVMVSDTVKVEDEEFNLRSFLQSVQNVVQIKADAAKLRLSVEADERLPEKIVSDPKKLTQILYNLLDNAFRYTPKGGKITLKVSPGETQGAKSTLIFTVKDTGLGLSQNKIKELLEADRLLESPQAMEKNKKRALGVAIVAKLAKTLGAAFDIQSKEGEGAAFSIHLPVRIAWQAKFATSDVPEMPLKILLVEDHFLNQIATKKVLTSWSPLVSVDIAENGAVGVQKFRDNGYDLILMDIQMPVMNGLDAARKIREFSDVPIIALTANSSKLEQDKCFEIKMNDYLAKPFKPQELYGKIMGIMSLVMN